MLDDNNVIAFKAYKSNFSAHTSSYNVWVFEGQMEKFCQTSEQIYIV